MSYSFTTSLLDIDRQPGKAPILLAETPGDAPGWAVEHQDALRALVAEHGSDHGPRPRPRVTRRRSVRSFDGWPMG